MHAPRSTELFMQARERINPSSIFSSRVRPRSRPHHHAYALVTSLLLQGAPPGQLYFRDASVLQRRTMAPAASLVDGPPLRKQSDLFHTWQELAPLVLSVSSSIATRYLRAKNHHSDRSPRIRCLGSNMSTPPVDHQATTRTIDKISDVVESLIVASAPGNAAVQDQMRAELLRRRGAFKDERTAFASLNSSQNLSPRDRDRVSLVDFLDAKSNGLPSFREALGKEPLSSLASLRDFGIKFDNIKIEDFLGDERDLANRKILAQSIITAVFLQEPEGVIENLLETGLLLKKENDRQAVQKVIHELASMDIAQAALNKTFAESPQLASQPAVVRDLVKRLARLQSISPSPAALIALWDSGAISAAEVSQVSIENMRRALGTTSEETAKVKQMAINATNRNRELAANLYSFIMEPAFNHLLGGEDKESRVSTVRNAMVQYGMDPTLEGLLGSLDYGIVDENQTVYSPTAYFVDLLQYLRKSKTDGTAIFDHTRKGEEASFEGTALQALYRRRPDLLHMNLSPENTTTVLPYIDLVNEVMESFVFHLPAFKKDTSKPRQAKIDAYNVDGRDSQDLLAQPQNFRNEAYRQLAGAVYPTQLPYHQPLDAQRAFLSFLGTTRLELVTELRARAPELNDRARNMHQKRMQTADKEDLAKAEPKNADVHLAELQDHALDAQQDCEVLGICQEEYLIWTKGVFWEKDHFIHTEGLPSLSDDEYRRRVGLKETWSCFGYASAKELLAPGSGACQVKQELLPRLGLSYASLVEIVQTRFCNPNFPAGRDKLIMEALGVSYRHLQTYTDTNDPDAYGHMSRYLAQNELLMVQFRNTESRGKMSDADLLVAETAALRDWLARHFPSLGKVTVLDKGSSVTLLPIGQVFAEDSLYPNGPTTKETVECDSGRLVLGTTRYRSAAIGRLDADGSLVRPDGQRIGSVDINGRVSYAAPTLNGNISTKFPNMHFTVDATDGQWNILDGILCKDQVFERSKIWQRNENLGDGNIDHTTLVHLDGSSLSVDEWDRIHLFARIWRTLKWSVGDTDRALMTACQPHVEGRSPAQPDVPDSEILEPTSNEDAIKFNDFVDSEGNITPSQDPDHLPQLPTINHDTVKQLAALVQIVKISGLPVEDILTIWSPMSSVGSSSQYTRLFRRRNLRQVSSCFVPDHNGNLFTGPGMTITSERLTVIAGLHISNTELDYLLSSGLVKDELNLRQLSEIYGHGLIARVLSVKITDLAQIYRAFGTPSDSPVRALHVMKQWEKIANTAVPWQELRFILDSVPTPNDPLALTQIGSLRVSKQLCDAVLKVHNDQPPVGDHADYGTLLKTAESRLGQLLEASAVQRVLQLLQDTTTWETKDFPYIGQQNEKRFKYDLADIAGSRAIYAVQILEPSTSGDRNAKPDYKCSLKVTGILADDQYARISGAVRKLLQPDARRRKRGADKNAEVYRKWEFCLDTAKQQPVKVLLDTLTGVLPRQVLEDEVSGTNRNILAPDVFVEAAEENLKATIHSTNVTLEERNDFDTTISASTSLFTTPDGHSSSILPHHSQDGSTLFVRPHHARFMRESSASSIRSFDSDTDMESDHDVGNHVQALAERKDPDEEDYSVRSSAEKFRFILVHLTPFLHRRLTYNSVIDTLASVSGFTDTEVAKVLLENVLTAQQSHILEDKEVTSRIGKLLEILPQGELDEAIRKLPATPGSVASKKSDLAEQLHRMVYEPLADKKKTQLTPLEQVMDITKLQNSGTAKALLDNITSLVPATPQSALDFVMKSVSDTVDHWQGYLQPPETANWTFEWRGHRKPEGLFFTEFEYISQLDSSLFVSQGHSLVQRNISFTQRIDASGRVKYVSNPVPLNADKKYAVRLPLSWIGNKEEFLWRPSELAESGPVPLEVLRAWWKGYLYPSIRDVYSFSVKREASGAWMVLNNERQGFMTRQDGSNGGMWSDELNQTLDSSTLHTLELHGCTPSDLQWKIGGGSLGAIPNDALLPEIAPAQMDVIFQKMKKLALLFKHLPLNSREVLFMSLHDTWPHLDGVRDIGEWLQVQDYVALKKALPSTTSRSLLDLFSWAASVSNATLAELKLQLRSATGWDDKNVHAMLTKSNFTSGKSSEFRDGRVLSRFQRLMVLSRRLDLDVATLFEWATPMGTATDEYGHYHRISQNIQRMAKAKFDSDTWVKAVRTINNKLRENQSKALISYLLVQKELTEEFGIHDADGLFEYFLIDVQMTSLVETSRVVQATSSVQLFIQRCFLGLEASRGVASNTLDRNRWHWMEKYRVWEANRKVYLYPENWIEPSLRDDKTEQFKELESELLQKNMTAETVDSAIKRFVSNVARISSVEAIALCLEPLGDSGKRIHVFARTHTTPFAYLYNSFTSNKDLKGFWAGWQDLNIDIPHVDDPRVKDSAGGSQLAPVVFQGRLILFVAEFISRQVVQEIPPDAGKRGDMPVRAWDIRMSYTECRDGRWIPRQTCALAHSDTSPGRTPGGYVMVPSADQQAVSLTVYWPAGAGESKGFEDFSKKTATGVVAAWSFDGVHFVKVSQPSSGEQPAALYFGFKLETNDGEVLESVQSGFTAKVQSSDRSFTKGTGPQMTLSTTATSASSSAEKFYNAMSSEVLAASAETAGCEKLFARLSRVGMITKGDISTFDPASADLIDVFGAFKSKTDLETWSFNERSKLYSLHNWELGLHIPMITIEKLLQSQQYERALRMCHNIFDPSVPQAGEKDDARRCWKFVPFKVASTVSVTQMFMRLNANEEDVRIQEWRDNPFLPHLVARSRPQAYMRWVMSTYIKILIAWGDSLFKQNTLESIPQAIQLYVLASHVYGPRGEAIPRQKQVQAQSFWSLCKRFDDFSNAMVELEQSFPYSQQTPLAESALFDEQSTYTPTIFGSAETLYFSIPDNPAVRALATTIDDRLFKIRNSQDINGTFRKLPLFAPPIDPALLVQATAQGLSLESVLQDLQAPLPNCKVSLLFSKAFELINEVRGLGQSLLSIREKKDIEQLSMLRQRHEIALQKTIMESRNLQLDEAAQALENLQSTRTAAVSRLTYFLQLVDGNLSGVPDVDREFQELDARISKPISEGGLGLSDMENESMKQSANADIISATSTAIMTAAGVLDCLPNTAAQAQPLGVGGTLTWGPANVAAGMHTVAGVIGLAGDIIRHKAGMASTKAGYQRAMQERIMQANAAGHEVVSIDKQITSAKIRIAMVTKDIAMQQQQMDQSQEIMTFFREKYATSDLYSWMDGVTKTLYHQYYTNAFELAKKAELAFRFERPQQKKSSFIQSGYFDCAHDGLLAGENLYYDLKRLEMEYMQAGSHDFEVTKSISLRLLNPVQLLHLRQEGSCEFELDELLFDMDFPGHYLRRIKSVAVTVPCVVGPYTTINGTLTLTSSEIRIKPSGKQDYQRNASAGAEQADDGRFATMSTPIQRVAVCSGQADAGVFQLDFSDSSTRYLPFEGAGAVSKWRFELPQVRHFDYDTIFDVVLQMRYTSLLGSDDMKSGAQDAVKTYLKASESSARTTGRTVLIDISAEHATAWSTVRANTDVQSVQLGNLSQRLPYFTRSSKGTLTISSLRVLMSGTLTKCTIKVGDKPYELLEKSAIGALTGMSKQNFSNSDVFGDQWRMDVIIGGKEPPKKCLLLISYLTSL
ncbi:hypothetical protein CERZMDRAFT_86627 [Cercospora zeae-maydis SCOH1-5]|uniref:Uncharacterized protein n=1 Tax=Cercospora zeae-maydis SCOH1-5 TaxID=717836 RepID=A0A6A6F9D7_9PEZI|nr:hypothetical protein CERZMDRAFT_86627 [Cercospora zeae-maydis SCOH1-5]